MYSIDGDFPFISPLLATYLHIDFIGTSLELRHIIAVRSPRERRHIADGYRVLPCLYPIAARGGLCACAFASKP